MTYYHRPSNISTGYDEVSVPDETAIVDYLVWKIDSRLNSFLTKADRMRRQETSGRITVLKPNIYRNTNRIRYNHDD